MEDKIVIVVGYSSSIEIKFDAKTTTVPEARRRAAELFATVYPELELTYMCERKDA